MLVKSTAGRAEVRRSTSGCTARASNRPHNGVISTAAANSPHVRGEDQPHAEPFETATSRQTRIAVSPSAPGMSNRPGARTGDSGTTRQIMIRKNRLSTAETQNMVCQLT